MSWNLRRDGGLLVIAILLVTLAFFGSAQSQVKVAAPAVVGPPGTPAADEKDKQENEFSHNLTLPTDSKMQRRMERAVDLIGEKDWAEAAKQLQTLLDAPEDVFVKVARKDANGKESTHWTSVRAEANRLLGTFPENGISFYELQFGGAARNKLDEAKAKVDPQILADVAQKYLHTKAGAEATNLLGTYHLDRGRYVMAALCFERLIGRDGADKLSTASLVKATLSFHRTGDKQHADQAWKQITTRSAREGLRLGDRSVTLTEVDALLKKYDQPLSELFSPSEWLMFTGTPSRSAQGIGSAPYMDRTWSIDGENYIREKDTRDFISKAIMGQLRNNQPILPAFFPIAVDGKIIFRSYFGVHAYEAKTGNLEWESPSYGSLDRLAYDTQKMAALRSWSEMYEKADPNLFYENSTLGTLSSDNARVYVIDDLALPPHPSYLLQYGWAGGWAGGQAPNFGPLTDAVNHNKLQAFDLKTGKILWELGGRGGNIAATDNKVVNAESLNDSYFLGPPMPLGGKLFVLNEKAQELRLVCLDPSKDVHRGENPIVWSQTLAAMREKILQDVSRRIRVASLAYGDGIIVCPTNAGAILGVDLLSHSLVWAYAYRDKSQPDSPDEERRKQLAARPWMVQQQGPISMGAEQWKASTPIIQDGKVVFTAPDGAKVFCLNLRDGSLRWNAERKDDLYLAGVYNGRVLLVGKNACRALDLADGKQIWTHETGMPSGQGVASDNIYYLPLRSGAQSKEPEVCLLDIEKGTIVAQPRSRKKEVPGNLIFYEGDVVSQSATDIAIFPQLKVKRKQMDELIAKNPRDPRGLTERGELKLDEGDFTGAIDDLHLALQSNPPAELLPKTRTKLYETLTAVMQHKFNDGEKYLQEYKDLCKVEFTPMMSEDDRKKAVEEEQRRTSNYLCLLAKGREKQGRLVEAFQAYMDFGVQAGKQELVSVIDEPDVKAPPDVWAQGRISAMVASAAPAQRKPLEDEIIKKWQDVKSSDIEALRRFVTMFGSAFSVGKEARMQLAERLLEENPVGAMLEAERHLLVLRQQSDTGLAARAVDGLARLATRNGRLDDAAFYYRILGKDFADVVVRDGRKGSSYYEDLATDKRFLPYYDDQVIARQGKWVASVEHGNFNMQRNIFSFDTEDEALPFFQHHRLVLDTTNHQFKLLDRVTGEERWSTPLTRTHFQMFAGQNNQPSGTGRFLYQLNGHLVVLNLGQMVYGIDCINRKVLWEKSLVGSGSVPQPASVTADPDGSLVAVYSDGWKQKVGQAAPAKPSHVCLITRDNLLAIDPVTGRTLWTRGNVSPRMNLFGDGQLIYLADTNTEGGVISSKALRAYDGVTVDVPDFGATYAKRLRVLGSRILASETDDKVGVTLRLYDVPAGKDLWKITYPLNSIVMRGEDSHLVGTIQPDGKLTVLDVGTGKSLLSAQVDPKDVEKPVAVHLLRDATQFYAAIQLATDSQVVQAGPFAAVSANSGIRSLPLNGQIYAFDPANGKLRWKAEAPHQMLVTDQFHDLPIMILAAQYNKSIAVGAGRSFQRCMSLRSIDKRTGKLLHDQPEMLNANGFFGLNADLKGGRIELLGYSMKLIHRIGDGTASALGQTTSQTPPPPVGVNRVLTTTGRIETRIIIAPRVAPPPPPPALPPPPPPKEKK